MILIVLNTCQQACDFLSWQTFIKVLRKQFLVHLAPMLIYDSSLKLAEFVP